MASNTFDYLNLVFKYNNTNNNNQEKIIARVDSVHLMNVEQRQVAADPQTKPPDFSYESTCRLLSSTTTIAPTTRMSRIICHIAVQSNRRCNDDRSWLWLLMCCVPGGSMQCALAELHWCSARADVDDALLTYWAHRACVRRRSTGRFAVDVRVVVIGAAWNRVRAFHARLSHGFGLSDSLCVCVCVCVCWKYR